jgi:hypothetical protein
VVASSGEAAIEYVVSRQPDGYVAGDRLLLTLPRVQGFSDLDEYGIDKGR